MEESENLEQNLDKSNEKLHISDVIKRLPTDDSEITFGDYFLEVDDYNFIHILVENDDSDEDYVLPNGIEVVPLTMSDFDWNKKMSEYRRIVNVL